MANNTTADYISSILAMVQEDRDDSEGNQLYRRADVLRALNAGRRRIIRKVGVGLYRTSSVTDATAGAIDVPADFFNEGIIRYAPNATTRTTLKPITSKYQDETNASWDAQATGTPSGYSWEVTLTGPKIRLHPAPTSTITDGLLWSYTALIPDLEDDADECPIMNMFPEFQETTLQAGAIRILALLEGGEADDQVMKFSAILEDDIEQIRAHINRLFVASSPSIGGR